MTQDEIIEMAEQCGIDPHDMCEDPRIAINNLEAFAKLVAAKAVRESSAEYRLGWNDGQIAEREACAETCLQVVASQEMKKFMGDAAHYAACTAAIRARGQQ